MDAFYEEDERIVGHAADLYHRIDIRLTSRHFVVHDDDRVIADTMRPLVLYESGFAPRWYVPRADVDEAALTPVDGQTFCPYKGIASYYDIGEQPERPGPTATPGPRSAASSDLVSFEADKVEVYLDGRRCTSSRARASWLTASTVASTPTRSSPAPVTGPDHVVA